MKGLRAIRKARGMTLQDVETATGIALGTISRYERGITNPTAETAARIAQALGATVDELINGPDNDKWALNVSYDMEEIDVAWTKTKRLTNVNFCGDGVKFTIAVNQEVLASEEEFEDLMTSIRDARDFLKLSGEEYRKLLKKQEEREQRRQQASRRDIENRSRSESGPVDDEQEMPFKQQ